MIKCDEYCGELLITHQDPPGASLTGDQLPGPVLRLGHEVSILPSSLLAALNTETFSREEVSGMVSHGIVLSDCFKSLVIKGCH